MPINYKTMQTHDEGRLAQIFLYVIVVVFAAIWSTVGKLTNNNKSTLTFFFQFKMFITKDFTLQLSKHKSSKSATTVYTCTNPR